MAICCPVTLTGFCLEDGTPIGIVVSSGVQTGWINFETGITTPGPPPAGTETCPVLTEISLNCATDSVSACVPYDYFEDSPHVSGDIGAFVLAVRNDSGLPLAADGDYIPFTTDEFGALRVAASVAINYAYPEDTPHVSGDIGVFNLAVRNDAGVALAADGDYIPFTTDSTGALRVAASVTINSEYPEDSPHVSGDIGSFSLAVRNDAGTPLAADGDYIPFTTDATGALRVTSSAPTINFEYPEDSPHVSGDIGAFTLGVRNDTGAVLTSANGDYSPFATDSAGRIGIADLGGSISIDDNGGSITVDGTVTVLQGTSPWVVSGTVTADTNFDFAEDSAHVSGDIGAFVLAVRNDTGAVLTSADGDYSAIAVNASGRVFTFDISDRAEDSVHTSGDVGSFVLAVRNDAGTPLAADGDYIPFTTDSTGALRVTSTGGTVTQFAEDSAHTSGDLGIQTLAVRNDTPGTLVSADGDYASFQQDGAGGIRVAGTITHDTAIVTATHSPILIGSRAQDNNTTITSVAAGDVTFNLADLKGVQFMKEQRTQLLGIYFAGSGPHQLANAADAATGGRVWLVNTSSTIAVALKEILFTCISGTALVTLSFPRINVERMTFTGTPTGAQILPALRDSTDAANTGTLRTASTGMTITAGNLIKNFSPVTVLTAVGVSMPSEQQLEMQAHIDDRIVLRQNEGIVVRQADAGTPADTRRFFLDFRWEEYTL